MNFGKIQNIFIVLIAAVVLLMPVFAAAQEAELFLTPSNGTYNKGSQIKVNAQVNTDGANVNAAEAKLNFDPKLLQVKKVYKGSSLNIWVTEPQFNNQQGTITFSGGSPQAFQGSSKNLISMVFEAKGAGKAKVDFTSGVVTKADGQGTDILKQTHSGIYDLNMPEPSVGLPEVPSISSPTHPKPNNWYADNSPKFEWNLPQSVTAVRLLVSRSKRAPTVLHRSLVAKRQVKDLKDGIWYFSAQFRNEAGWGDIKHFKFQIDTKPPGEFSITKKPQKGAIKPTASFEFDAKDETSGISNYEIWIDGKKQKNLKNEEEEIYTTPKLDPGQHKLNIHAVDFAGNYSEESSSFKIKSLEAPRITYYFDKVATGEKLVVKGTAHPSYKAQMNIEKPNGKVEARTTGVNEKGEFKLTHPGFSKQGIYKVWITAVNDWGARSKRSETVKVKVHSPFVFYIGKLSVHYAVVILLMLLIAALILLYIFWWRQRRVEKYAYPQRKIREQIEYLDKKIKAEKVARRKLRKLLGSFGFSVKERVKGIESRTGIKLHKLSSIKESKKKEGGYININITDLEEKEGYININTAGVEELTNIIHIGEHRARDLIKKRPFKSINDLKRIDGIGPKELKDIKKRMIVQKH